jgi:hypothetical protein
MAMAEGPAVHAAVASPGQDQQANKNQAETWDRRYCRIVKNSPLQGAETFNTADRFFHAFLDRNWDPKSNDVEY